MNMCQIDRFLQGSLSNVRSEISTFDDSYDLAIGLWSDRSKTCVSSRSCISPPLDSTSNARRLPEYTHSLLLGLRRSQLLSAYVIVKYILVKTSTQRV